MELSSDWSITGRSGKPSPRVDVGARHPLGLQLEATLQLCCASLGAALALVLLGSLDLALLGSAPVKQAFHRLG